MMDNIQKETKVDTVQEKSENVNALPVKSKKSKQILAVSILGAVALMVIIAMIWIIIVFH